MGEFVSDPDPGACEIDGCDGSAAVRLDVPWEGLRDVCPAHGRVWARKEGVVALPIEQAKAEWSGGSGVEGADGSGGEEGSGGEGEDGSGEPEDGDDSAGENA